MLGYGYNVTVDDRWRIVMYVRALQRGQNAPLTDATPEEQAALDKTKKPAAPAAGGAAPAPAGGGAAPAAGGSAPAAGATAPTPNPSPGPETNGAPNPPQKPAGAAKPPGTAFHSAKPQPVVLLTQQSMKGWLDSIDP